VSNDGGCCEGWVEGYNATHTADRLLVCECGVYIVGMLMTVIAALAETFRSAKCEAHEPRLSRKRPRFSLGRHLSPRHRYPNLIKTRLIRSLFSPEHKHTKKVLQLCLTTTNT
jgi:hypothetical protein